MFGVAELVKFLFQMRPWQSVGDSLQAASGHRDDSVWIGVGAVDTTFGAVDTAFGAVDTTFGAVDTTC